MLHVEVGGGRTGKPDITQAIGTEKHGYARIGIALSALKRRKLQVRQKQYRGRLTRDRMRYMGLEAMTTLTWCQQGTNN